MAGYKVKGPSTSLPGAFDVETDDGRVFPVAPSGLPEYEAPPAVEASQGEPTAYGDVMTIGRETVLDAGGSRPGLPRSASEMPRLPMPPREPRKAAPGQTVGKVEMPSEPVPPAPAVPAVPSVDMPGAMTPDAAANKAVAEEEAFNRIAGTGRYTGPPTRIEQTTSYQNRILTPEAQAEIAARDAAASEKEAAAKAAEQRAVELQAQAMNDKAAAIQRQQEAQAEARKRMEDGVAAARAKAEEIRQAALRDDQDAEELRSRYGTADTFRRIAGAVGMFFAGRTGDPVGTINMINANIDANWQRNMRDLEAAQGKGDRKRSYAAQLIEESGGIEAAYHRFRAESIEASMAEAEKLALQSGSQEAMERFQALRANGEAERERSAIAAIMADAPLVERKETMRQNKGGVVGGPSKEVRQRYYKALDESEAEARGARTDVRKATLEAQKPGKAGTAANPAQEKLMALEGARVGLEKALRDLRSESGMLSGASEKTLVAKRAQSAQMLKNAGMDELADAVKRAQSQAEVEALLEGSIGEVSRTASTTRAAVPVNGQTIATERQAKLAAGDFSAVGGTPRR